VVGGPVAETVKGDSEGVAGAELRLLEHLADPAISGGSANLGGAVPDNHDDILRPRHVQSEVNNVIEEGPAGELVHHLRQL
jgi:hypothetical protein